jgi:hypothetical protein
MADHRLDLAQAPVGLAGMAHEVAGAQETVTGFFEQVSVIPACGYDEARVTPSGLNLQYKLIAVMSWRTQ